MIARTSLHASQNKRRNWPTQFVVLSLVTSLVTIALLGRSQQIYAAASAAPASATAAQFEAQKNGGGDDGVGDDNGGDDIKVYARLVSRPEGTDIGPWVIGDKSYTVTAQTEITTLHGPFVINGCVEVEVDTASPTIAKEIGSEEESNCTGTPGDDNGGDDSGGGNGGGDDNGGDDNGGDNDVRHYGHLDSRPDGTAGSWIVEGVAYSATAQTELHTEHGALVVGVCVKVKSPVSNATFAQEIESEEDYKCSGRSSDDDSSAEGKLFGMVESLPAGGREGTWVIGGNRFTATVETNFNSEGGIFTVGSLVKVEFYTVGDTGLVAKEIELKLSNGHSRSQDGLAKIYALIESRPEGTLLGLWTIGGIEYLVDADTRLDDVNDDSGHGDYLVGDRVKVKYGVQEDGSRRATEINETDDNGGLDDSGHMKIVGFVESTPAGFVGTWTIAGTEFQTALTTVFEENDGLFAVGAYVEVEYLVTDNVRIVYKMETHVPPGAGDDSRIGSIDSIDNTMAAATVNAISATSWTIGGQSYFVDVATDLDNGQGEMVVGAKVMVNSYLASNGQQAATQIRTVTLDEKILLPLAIR